MARLPYVDRDSAPPKVREVLELLPADLNIFRMAANSETTFRPFLGLGTALLGSKTFDPKLRELVILHVGKVSGGRYEWAQHVPIAKAVGAADAELEALDTGDIDAACFSELERAVLRFSGEVAESCRAGDATFAAVAEHLGAGQIVELITIVGFYRMVAMLTETTDIEIDEPVGTAVVDAVRS